MAASRTGNDCGKPVRGGLEIDYAAGQLLYFSPIWNDGDISAARRWWRQGMRRQPDPAKRALMQEILEYMELLHSIRQGPFRGRVGKGRGRLANPDRKNRPRRGWVFYFGATVFNPIPASWRRA